jgi:hypothetical protein
MRVPVAALNLAALKTLGTVAPLGRRSIANVAVVAVGSERQLWVAPAYGDYRSAWLIGIGPIAPGTDVDHIYHRSRAGSLGYEYVRLMLVAAGANQQAGAGYEKRATQLPPPPPGRSLPAIRYADLWQLTKTSGTRIGTPSDGYAGVKAFVRANRAG